MNLLLRPTSVVQRSFARAALHRLSPAARGPDGELDAAVHREPEPALARLFPTLSLGPLCCELVRVRALPPS